MMTPLQAVVSADPYPYYAALVRERPLAFDEQLGFWVASSAEAVSAILLHSGFRVRPPDSPVPPGLVDTAAGAVFARLVRMTDGHEQRKLKLVVSTALSTVDVGRAAAIAHRRALQVLEQDGAGTLGRLMFEVPVGVVGELSGLPPTLDVSGPTAAFVGCIPASATAADQMSATRGAITLSSLLAPRLVARGPDLAGDLARAATDAEVSDAYSLVANSIGLLSQTYDATAGLIGNTLLALRHDKVGGIDQSEVASGYMLEVARHDAPVQNTRRFAQRQIDLMGVTIAAGQGVLVLLAAANRDPAVNDEPDTFRPDRRSPALFTFGLGNHACPGRSLAVTVATAVVRAAIEHGLDPISLPGTPRYRPLANARIPEL